MRNPPLLTVIACALATTASTAAAVTLSTIASFDISNGSQPITTLSMDSAANLYGTTYYGGSTNNGAIFKYDAASTSLTAVTSFNPLPFDLPFEPGLNPVTGVVSSRGSFYGIAFNSNGGYGTLYRWNAGLAKPQTLVDFHDNGTGPQYPASRLLIDSAGVIHGTTLVGAPFPQTGGGTIFRFNTNTNAYETRYTFPLTQAGANGDLTFGPDGAIYGTTLEGGANNLGTLFRFDPNTQAFSTLASFTAASGFSSSGVVFDAQGNLYGSALRGGTSDKGTCFRLAAGASTIDTLVNFDGTNGAYPGASLIVDAAGQLFGTTRGSELAPVTMNPDDYGTVFRYDPATMQLTTLADFDGPNGAWPHGPLLADEFGTLFGSTRLGGATYIANTALGEGSLFKITDAGFVVPEPTTALTFVSLLLLASQRRRK
jgi:uncharacterized repeat protein (TIGR03803 family)